MKYEHRHEGLLPIKKFLRRVGRHVVLAAGIIAGSLLIGVVGYRWLEGWRWVDCVLEASMILGGMGPVHEIKTDAGKIFASVYALYSGVTLLTTIGVLFAPIFHRFLHRFHLERDSK